MSKRRGYVEVNVGSETLEVGYIYDFHAWEGGHDLDYEIEDVFVLEQDQNLTGTMYWRRVDWENEMHDQRFAHISTERLEKAVALDIANNAA